MKNKKGENLLPEEIFKIILAAICIILLLILAVALYGIFIAKTKIEQAKATLEIISEKIENVKKNNLPVNIVINSPRDYYLYFRPQTKDLCFAKESSSIEHPIASIRGILDPQSEICKKIEYNLIIKNKNYNEDVIAIYQSTPCEISKGQEENIFIICNTGSTSKLQRFFSKNS